MNAMSHLTSTFLDSMRLRGDDLADETIRSLVENNQIDAVNAVMAGIVRNEDAPPASLPEPVQEFLRRSLIVPSAAEDEKIRAGQEVFARFGPEVLMVLGLYSIPAAYAARGVEVLHQTTFFEKRTMRRIWETTQFVVDVMTPGGHAAGGCGLRSAQKVRLMHAAIRHRLLHRPGKPWDTAGFGLPINQEDLAATLMEFSCVVLEGLRRMGIALSREDQEAFLHVWRWVGAVLGVDERLVPRDVDAAYAVARTIAARQVVGSQAGRDMVGVLIEEMERTTMPLGFEGFVVSAMRFFLEDETISGQDVAALLGLPPPDWTGLLVRLAGLIADSAGQTAGLPGRLLSAFKLKYLQIFLQVERGPQRPKFRIPEHLYSAWMRDA